MPYSIKGLERSSLIVFYNLTFRMIEKVIKDINADIFLAGDVQTEVSYRYKRARVVISMHDSISHNARFNANSSDEGLEAITTMVQDTRNRTENSRLYINAMNTGVIPELNQLDYFLSVASTFINTKRLFNILSMREYRKRFISIDIDIETGLKIAYKDTDMPLSNLKRSLINGKFA
ncbi:MAG: hypothetical protein EXX96DRAFT_537585 [Benjaminiella poitrasii]|nr:MAG: hypothetical protein EXX96DRAFT_537585 [Benjaminiella poitrasii]